ncbi:MAG TPA: hypothetical protein VIJ27_04740 [Mucilaginibacter sp.]
MDFEEFFKKKRIDLAALEQGESGLFSEFKTDFGQMGEKSFDYTKKYWFNKLRRQFPLSVEVKTEKARSENPLAEQTVLESLTETIPARPSPELGFVPKFRMANIAKPVVNVEDKKEGLSNNAAGENTKPEKNEVKPAYKPRFNIKNIPPKV